MNPLDPPVYLYIKTHNVTGLKYFGRTIKDPTKYLGSGLHWKRHLAKHGVDVSTEILGCYTDAEQLHKEALEFSIANEIVASAEWANLITETGYAGIDGWEPDDSFRQIISKNALRMWADEEKKAALRKAQSRAWTAERKLNHSAKIKNNWSNPEYRQERLANMKPLSPEHKAKLTAGASKPRSEETKQRMSEAMKGVPKSEAHKLASSKARKGVPIHIPPGVTWDSENSWFVTDNGLHIQRTPNKANSWFCVESGEEFRSRKEAVSKLLLGV